MPIVLTRSSSEFRDLDTGTKRMSTSGMFFVQRTCGVSGFPVAASSGASLALAARQSPRNEQPYSARARCSWKRRQIAVIKGAFVVAPIWCPE